MFERLRSSCNRFLRQEMTSDDLLRDAEGICGAIEDRAVALTVSNFIVNIEDSRHLYDDDEGRRFLEKKIHDLFG